MNTSNSVAYVDYLLSLPQREAALREQAEWLLREADEIAGIFKNLERERLDGLTLTGNPKLDAALRLSMESGRGGADWLKIFPQILERLERAEREIAEWKTGGLALVDFTPQKSFPTCLEISVVEVSAEERLRITTDRCYFQSIPITIWVAGRCVITANSSTEPIGIMRHESVDTTCIDLVRLFHPNWGTWHIPLAGIFLGEKAIARHIDDWKEFVNEGCYMGKLTQAQYLQFLNELSEAIRSHECAIA